MGISTASIGLIPSYQQIGFYASILLVLFRILQNMALGSEFLNSALLLVESGNEQNRGFRGCWSSVGVKTGNLLACLIGQITLSFCSNPMLPEWLWRLPFLLAFVMAILGFYIRYTLPESLAYIKYYAARPKPTTRIIYRQSVAFTKKAPFLFTYAFCSSFMAVTIGFFFYITLSIHANEYTQLPRSFIMSASLFSLVLVIILIPIFGWFSDKGDRLKMLALATVGLLILAYPFMYAINFGNRFFYLFMQLLISIPCACYLSVSSVILTELFPLPISCTALSIVFSIAASLASGAPALIANYLANFDPTSPCLIIIVLSIIMLVNITILALNYRIGKNRYDIFALEEQKPLFSLNYTSRF